MFVDIHNPCPCVYITITKLNFQPQLGYYPTSRVPKGTRKTRTVYHLIDVLSLLKWPSLGRLERLM